MEVTSKVKIVVKFSLYLATCVLCFSYLFHKSIVYNYRLNIPSQPHPPSTIHIVTVVCTTKDDASSREEAAVMVKSVVISALIYKLPRITFHVLVDYAEDGEFLIARLREFGHPFPGVEISLLTYILGDVLPLDLQKFMNYGGLRCNHMRFFFPRILPLIDAVVYFDVDVIVINNVAKYWYFLAEMNENHLIAATVNRPPECESKSPLLGGYPYPKPNGVMSGVLIMNLTRMRMESYEEVYIQAFSDYSRLVGRHLLDQPTLNLMFFYNRKMWKVIPCHYNFWEVHCTDPHIMCCPTAMEDPEGVMAIHGAASSFAAGKVFWEVYKIFTEINITASRERFKEDLMLPIRQEYMDPLAFSQGNNGSNKSIKCEGLLGKYLFRSHFE